MVASRPIIVSGAVEGDIDEAVLRRLLDLVGAKAGPVHGKNGKAQLLQRLRSYGQAARFSAWFVLVDLDHDASCAPGFVSRWLPEPVSDTLCFRVAVREVEAWLLADREGSDP